MHRQYKKFKEIPNEIDSDFKVIVTSDFKKDYYDYSSKKDQVEIDKVGVPELNGIVIMPDTEQLNFTVLISQKQFEDLNYIHTLIHEFTHVYDYFQYFSEFGNVYIKGVSEKDEKYFWEFYNWSEYHAKRLGTLYYSVISWHLEYGEELPPSGKYEFVVNFYSRELEQKIRTFNESLNSMDPNRNNLFWELFQEIMAYYGRLSVFQGEKLDIYPDSDFPKEGLIKTFGHEIIDLYNLLLKLEKFETVAKYLNEIKKLKQSIISRLQLRDRFTPDWLRLLKLNMENIGETMKDLKKIDIKIPELTNSLIDNDPRKLLNNLSTPWWSELIVLTKKLVKNTEEIKKDLKDLKCSLDKKKT